MTNRKFPDDFIPAVPRADKGELTTSEIVAMAWDDETSFDDIKAHRMWRKRVSGRASKHQAKI